MTNARWNTRRLYKFESEFRRGDFLNKTLHVDYLRNIASEVWKDLNRSYFNMPYLPHIRCGRGVPYNGSLYSYYQEDEGIVLARNQRTELVLYHELTHALGFDDHDVAFVSMYFYLLNRYGEVPWWELTQARIDYKI